MLQPLLLLAEGLFEAVRRGRVDVQTHLAERHAETAQQADHLRRPDGVDVVVAVAGGLVDVGGRQEPAVGVQAKGAMTQPRHAREDADRHQALRARKCFGSLGPVRVHEHTLALTLTRVSVRDCRFRADFGVGSTVYRYGHCSRGG